MERNCIEIMKTTSRTRSTSIIGVTLISALTAIVGSQKGLL